MTGNIPWTEEAFALMKTLLAEGLTAREISGQLWDRLRAAHSRNSVISKNHRHGLQRGPRKRGVAGTRRPRTMLVHVSKPSPGGYQPVKRAMARDPSQPAPKANCSLLELTANSCRWPLGDPREPGFCFCGGWFDATQPIPYCEEHLALARGVSRAA